MKFPEFKLISFVCYCASLALGLLIGYLDFFTTEVQGAVLLLLVATALLGYTNPEGAWRWATLTAFGIPLIHLLALHLGVRPAYPVSSQLSVVLLPQIPAFIGVYSGVVLRWVLSKY
jgi:hypothetical protein